MATKATRFAGLSVRVLSVATLVAACGARTALQGDEIDDTVASPRDGGAGGAGRARDAQTRAAPDAATKPAPSSAICAEPAAGFRDGGALCRRRLSVLEVKRSSADCFVDTVVKEGAVGELLYECGGGASTATFGGKLFRGAFDGARADVCTGTSFDWVDGCQWNSSQRLLGSVDDGELRFDYTEAPAPGEKGCFTPCTATARVLVLD